MDAFKAKVETLGWAFPMLTLHIVIHENAHAFAARAIGADLVQIHYLPGNGALGSTVWRLRHRTDGDFVIPSVAPQLVNLVTLSAYAVLYELGVPSNEHVRLPLTVYAFCAWSDLATQLLPLRRNDMTKVYRFLGAGKALPLRVLHAGVAVLGYYYLTRGYDSIIDEPMAAAVPRIGFAF